MAGVEVIALLCAGAVNYHAIPGGGQAGQLSRAELAGLLAGLSKPAMNLALAKYAGDMDAERLLIAHVRLWAVQLANREGWQIVKGRPTVSNMAALAVFELVRPNRCPRCQGRGMLVNRVCSTCSGSGYKSLSGRQIAEAVGVDECNYRRLWRGRYEQCYQYAQGIESQINYALHRNDERRMVEAI